MEYCFRCVWEAASASLVLIHSYPDHMPLWHLYMVTLASVADPRIFDPRVGDDKTYITTMGMQQTSVHVWTTSCFKTGWENRIWWSPPPSSGFTTWPQWNGRSFSQDHLWVIWTTEAGITTLASGMCICGYYYLNRSPALRSLIYVDVGEPTSHPCSMTGMIQDHHVPALQDFESFGTSMSGICYDIAKQYWAAWGLSESVVFHVVSWVSFWVVLVRFWLGCWFAVFVFVLFWRHLAFCSHLFSNMWE